MNDLHLVGFDHMYQLENIDEIISFWNTNMTEIFNIHAPFKTVRITKPPTPWFTDNIKLMMKLGDKAKLKHKKSKNNADWPYYKELRNFVNMAVKSEQRAYLQNQFKKNPKHFWKVLKYLNVHTCSHVSGRDFADSNEFNDYFFNKIPQGNIDEAFIANTYDKKKIPWCQ